MTVATVLEFSGVTQEQYDRMGAELERRGASPTGLLIHVCGPTEGGWRIADIWESAEAFERFADEWLIPTMEVVGGPRPSRREIYQTYHAGAFKGTSEQA
jgi:hypothetical protein